MKKKKGFYIAVGLMTGLLIGVYLDNIGLWLLTKFCPVYFILNKLMPETEPIQNGK